MRRAVDVASRLPTPARRSLGYEPGPGRLVASHWCCRRRPDVHRRVTLVSYDSARTGPSRGVLVTDPVTTRDRCRPPPANCPPVDLTPVLPRGRPWAAPRRKPSPTSPRSAQGRPCGSPPG